MIDLSTIQPGDPLVLRPHALCDRRVKYLGHSEDGLFIRIQCHNWPGKPIMELPVAMLEAVEKG